MRSGFSLQIELCDDKAQALVNSHKAEAGCHLVSFFLLTKKKKIAACLSSKMLTLNSKDTVKAVLLHGINSQDAFSILRPFILRRRYEMKIATEMLVVKWTEGEDGNQPSVYSNLP